MVKPRILCTRGYVELRYGQLITPLYRYSTLFSESPAHITCQSKFYDTALQKSILFISNPTDYYLTWQARVPT